MITAYFHDELNSEFYGYENKHSAIAKYSYADLLSAGFIETTLADDNTLYWHGFRVLSIWLKIWQDTANGCSYSLVIETGIMYHCSQDLLDSRYSTYHNSSDL